MTEHGPSDGTPPQHPDAQPSTRLPPVAIGLSVGLGLLAIILVALTLDRDPPTAYAPTSHSPREVGADRVGPVRVTLDASDPDHWIFFDFSRGSTIDRPDPLGWDLAFRRFNIAVNGGPGFAGQGGALALDAETLDSISTLPDSGYVGSVAADDSANAALEGWYDYGFTSHLLTPGPGVYAIRTADGRYAALRFLSYYCTGARPGCMSFEYVYLGAGGRRMR